MVIEKMQMHTNARIVATVLTKYAEFNLQMQQNSD